MPLYRLPSLIGLLKLHEVVADKFCNAPRDMWYRLIEHVAKIVSPGKQLRVPDASKVCSDMEFEAFNSYDALDEALSKFDDSLSDIVTSYKPLDLYFLGIRSTADQIAEEFEPSYRMTFVARLEGENSQYPTELRSRGVVLKLYGTVQVDSGGLWSRLLESDGSWKDSRSGDRIEDPRDDSSVIFVYAKVGVYGYSACSLDPWIRLFSAATSQLPEIFYADLPAEYTAAKISVKLNENPTELDECPRFDPGREI